MNILSKLVGFMAVFCVSGAADAALRAGGATTAATGRVSVATPVTTTASRRIPVMTTTVSTGTASNAALMAQTECVDSYTECIKDADACGSDFEECTTNELFYAQMPKCNSVLMQCASAGVSALFGTSNTASLSIDYVNSYPTAGSIIGQYITAGAILNRLDTGKCVQTYTRCLRKDSVCGEDFELCTSYKEFKKQKVFCESTLARCQEDGIKELFGQTDTTLDPVANSRLDVMIKEGDDLAKANAVSTCYKVADNCILSACAQNPFLCIEGTNKYLAELADEEGGKTSDNASVSEQVTKREITLRMRNACYDTIAGNKYCHMTVDANGKTPSAKDLRDEEKRDEVFDTIYTLRKNAVADKLANLRDKFDKQARDKCVQTIASCAVRSCGSGLGSACYELAFKTGDVKSVNNTSARPEIKEGCELIANADVNCQYAAAAGRDGYNYVYAYDYSGNGTFDYLFPERTSKDDTNDPILVVAALNKSLQEKYSDAAINDLAKQCKKTVESCIRNMCGEGFAKCYRNRSDIMSDTYSVSSDSDDASNVQKAWNAKFMNSMNKVSGILDFTIIRGLCGSVVNNSSVCEEHLKIQMVKDENN